MDYERKKKKIMLVVKSKERSKKAIKVFLLTVIKYTSGYLTSENRLRGD